MKLTDIGANLADSSFDKDRTAVIERALSHGVNTMIITGSSLKSSLNALDLAQKYPEHMYSTAGIHPHNARHCDQKTIPTLKSIAQSPKTVAVGECGLDYNRDFSPRPLQDKWFAAQIELACELNMPLFLHQRDAHDNFVAILDQFSQLPPVVVHCFTGKEQELHHYLERGFFIGITGWICDERRGKHLHNLVKFIPADKLMLETDAPYLLPRTIKPRPKSRRNEPAFLPYVLQTVAQCLEKEPEEVARATVETARKFFGLPEEG